MSPAADWIAFEQPLNERTRTFLRLQFLLKEIEHYGADRSDWGIRAGLRALLDTLSLLGRSDLKTELLKDLGEQQGALQRLQGRAEVNRERLSQTLEEITATTAALHRSASLTPAVLLRENDFLYAIHSRSAIPGGTCEFDLPAYHRWLMRDLEAIERDVSAWTARLRPFRSGVDLCLRLLRDSSAAIDATAQNGVFLYVPQAHYSLVRVQVPPEADVYPEISASKHRIAIRFMVLGDVNTRSVQAACDISFRLQCCSSATSSAAL